jgi:hypothetical protein
MMPIRYVNKSYEQLEAENEALLKAHLKQLLDTDYCFVCDRHGYDHDHDKEGVCPVSALLIGGKP